jgi:hypothetical protein
VCVEAPPTRESTKERALGRHRPCFTSKCLFCYPPSTICIASISHSLNSRTSSIPSVLVPSAPALIAVDTHPERARIHPRDITRRNGSNHNKHNGRRQVCSYRFYHVHLQHVPWITRNKVKAAQQIRHF